MKISRSFRPCRIAAVLAAAVAAVSATARPVDGRTAAKAAVGWLLRAPKPLGAEIAAPASVPAESSVRTAVGEDGTALFHVVHLEGGGYVVTSADDSLPPVFAFSDSGSPPSGPGNPVWDVLSADLRARTRALERLRKRRPVKAAAASNAEENDPFCAANAGLWAELAAGAPARRGTKASGYGVETIDDIRVPPLCKTRWGQNNVGTSTHWCYNYFTPFHWSCGCIATAVAQVMRYWRYPDTEVEQWSENCSTNGVPVVAKLVGGFYDWDSMVESPSMSTSSAQRRAIGTLCYDVGVASCMDWSSGVSSATLFDASWGLVNFFSYANAVFYGVYWEFENPNAVPATIAADDLARIVMSNADAGCPVVLGLDSHAAIADGYGFVRNVLYAHLNFGWEGMADAWYVLPDVECDWYSSSFVDEVVYNIFPRHTGELITGRVTDETGSPVEGATVRATDIGHNVSAKTDARGIYALHVEGGRSYSVRASMRGYAPVVRTETVPVAESVPFNDDLSVHFGYDLASAGNLCGVDFSLAPSSEDPGMDLSEVHRFYSKNYRGHFFTIDAEEAETIRNTNPNWKYEGVAYLAATEPSEGLVPLYRFYSKSYRGHFFTIDAEEAETIRNTNPNWKYEGIAYYVSPDPATDTVPVYRFWSKSYRHHFYTIDEDEMWNIRLWNANWKYEGEAFHAWPAD